MLVESVLVDCRVVGSHAIKINVRNAAYAVIDAAYTTFSSVIGVAAARPVHLVLGIGEASRVVVAERVHLMETGEATYIDGEEGFAQIRMRYGL